MSEEIITVYKADVNQFKAQLDVLEQRLSHVETKGKEAGKNIEKQFDKTKEKTKELNLEVLNFEKVVEHVGERILAAFAIEAVVEFGKSTIEEFQKAELSAKRLEVAVTKIGQEGKFTFDTLINQAKELQEVSIFSHTDIEKAQTALIQFGLTGDEVEKLIPKVLDLASATGGDLGSATETVIQGINGLTRGLKPLGIDFKDTGDKTENLAILTEKLGKYQGQTAAILETSAGKAKNLGLQWDDLKEHMGSYFTSLAVSTAQLVSFIFTNTPIVQDFMKLFSGNNEESEKGNELEKIAHEYRGASIEQRKEIIEGLKKEIEAKKNLLGWGDNSSFDKVKLQGEIAARKELIETLQNQKEAAHVLTEAEKAKREEEAKKAAEKREADKAKKFKEINDQREKDYNETIERIRKDEEQADKEAYRNQEQINKDREKNYTETIENIRKEEEKADRESYQAAKKLEKEKEELHKTEREALVETAQNIANAVFDIQKQGIEQQSQSQIADLEKKKEKELSNKNLTESQKEAINKRYQKKEDEVKKQQFEKNKQLSVEEAVINGAIAITKIFSSYVPPASFILAGVQAAATGAQIAVINAQKYAKGTPFLGRNGNPAGIDTVPIWANEGEAIIPTEKNMGRPGLAKAWIDGSLDEYIHRNYVLPALMGKMKESEERRSATFAQNIANSIHQMDEYAMARVMKRALNNSTLNIGNLDELGNMIQDKSYFDKRFN